MALDIKLYGPFFIYELNLNTFEKNQKIKNL